MRRIGWWIIGFLALVAAGLALWRPWRSTSEGLDQLLWGEVTRGDLEVTVSSTGTLGALDSVEVGTQVSGPITEIRVDFNDVVEKGQILAVIDTSLLEAALRDARAGHARARAEFDQAVADLAARRELFASGLVSKTELLSYETAFTGARSSLDSAQAQVERALQNRDNAVIRSPIDGVVVERAVEVGQTVAASFSTPRLFLLARDLRQMRILAEVDEGDIGQIRLEQEVSFQVAAQPDREFHGRVRQIRLQPKVDQNVVKYTVVVDATNEEGQLLPGMTATLEFVVERATDVLTVPAGATRVRPNEMMTRLLAATPAAGAEAESARRAPSGSVPGAGPGGRGSRGEAAPQAGIRRIYLRDEAGRLLARAVRLGLSDGRRVEIVLLGPPGEDIAPGTPVVIGVSGDTGSTTGRANPAAGVPRGFRPL